MELTEEKIDSYFIQENAITDMKNSSMTTLEEVFCERLMTYVIWPPSSRFKSMKSISMWWQIVYEKSTFFATIGQ